MDRYGFQARHRWGQNFLIDGNLAARIVDAADIRGDEGILEIGPGFGALTQRLLPRARAVVAVEIDRRLVEVLADLFAGEPRLQLIHGDARELDFGSLFPPDWPRKAVANLPYYVTTPLLFQLLDARPPFSVIVVMVQREVAERIIAEPGGKDYGALSVNVQARCAVEWIAAVPPSVFLPRPEVSSAVVRLTYRTDGLVSRAEHFSRVVRIAFAQRRKTLRNALRLGFDEDAVVSALAATGLDGARRAETLSPAEFAALAEALPPSSR